MATHYRPDARISHHKKFVGGGYASGGVGASRREARLIGRLAHRYGRDGLSPYERSELHTRAEVLRGAVNRPGNAGGGRRDRQH